MGMGRLPLGKAEVNRYSLGGEGDDAFEPGSNGQVLRNHLHIIDPRRMELEESLRLAIAIRESHRLLEDTTTFTFELVKDLHKLWLADLYSFAGCLRTVNLSKGLVTFAPCAYLTDAVENYSTLLESLTPCNNCSRGDLVSILARTHAEFIYLHPFREGNGRLGRWISDLLALQAGYEPLKWAFDRDSEMRATYFACLSRGFATDYRPLESLIDSILVEAI
jgi:cell filamentation protein